jgi:hypothetical protein
MLRYCLIFILCLANAALAAGQSLQLKWKSDTLLRVPESVYFDEKTDVLYVSNINGKSNEKDGNGFISQLSKDGKITNLKWATGLDAPKGITVVKGSMYVADLTRLVEIDMASGKISKVYEIEGAQFLNDVTADADGDVYVSDSATGKIHVLRNNRLELYLENKDFKRVNGLLAIPEGLYVADAGTGINYKLSKEKILSRYTETAQGADGIISVGPKSYVVSSWAGEIYFVDENAKAIRLLDTKEQKLNSADIDYNKKEQIIYVPTFYGNCVMAYALEGVKKEKQMGVKKQPGKEKKAKEKK